MRDHALGDHGKEPHGPEVRVLLPVHLRTLAGVEGEMRVAVAPPATLQGVLDSLEASHPVLRGTIRPHGGGDRRPLVRFYADGQDLSHRSPSLPLPEAVASGAEPLLVVGAIAGG